MIKNLTKEEFCYIIPKFEYGSIHNGNRRINMPFIEESGDEAVLHINIQSGCNINELIEDISNNLMKSEKFIYAWRLGANLEKEILKNRRKSKIQKIKAL